MLTKVNRIRFGDRYQILIVHPVLGKSAQVAQARTEELLAQVCGHLPVIFWSHLPQPAAMGQDFSEGVPDFRLIGLSNAKKKKDRDRRWEHWLGTSAQRFSNWTMYTNHREGPSPTF